MGHFKFSRGHILKKEIQEMDVLFYSFYRSRGYSCSWVINAVRFLLRTLALFLGFGVFCFVL